MYEWSTVVTQCLKMYTILTDALMNGTLKKELIDNNQSLPYVLFLFNYISKEEPYFLCLSPIYKNNLKPPRSLCLSFLIILYSAVYCYSSSKIRLYIWLFTIYIPEIVASNQPSLLCIWLRAQNRKKKLAYSRLPPWRENRDTLASIHSGNKFVENCNSNGSQSTHNIIYALMLLNCCQGMG